MSSFLTNARLDGQFVFNVALPAPLALPDLPALTTTVPQGNIAWAGLAGVYNGGSTTTYWTVPAGVYNISMIAIGGGGGGGGGMGSSGQNLGSIYAAGGGGLAYGSLQVTPGSNLTIVYGHGGGNYIGYPGSPYLVGTYLYASGDGGTSKVRYNGTDIVTGVGGYGITTTSGSGGGFGYSGADPSQPRGGANGGAGRNGTSLGTSGGGGAAGYSGNGGLGGANSTGGAGSGGSGGGGYRSSGGGVGIYGAGTSASAQSVPQQGGFGGSGGSQAVSTGGSYGGGGGGSALYISSIECMPQYGGPGAVRIVWGPNRRYPDVANVTNVPLVAWVPNSPRDMPNIIAWYDASSVDINYNLWYDRLGNTALSATLTDCSLVGLGGGNGANTNLSAAVSGTPASSITWPAGLVSSSYTIFHVTRYSGSNKQRIYSTTGSEDWASGHINGAAGQFKHGSLLTGSDGSTDYYGENWFVTTDQLNIGRTNGITRGTGSGITTYPTTLAINKYSTEKSDFQTACLIVCNGAMSNVYYTTLETWLRNYYGITS
jgi:hypothetical protein